ncbi:hypothetical protein GEU84_006375 [Fertoebacter nigrum]|uniref:Uncharacterized protein n=1 Tax=Fertoeibacter niger TaxID=2656921 RepID=A0A8X8KK83_9RHOB|nr:hypothetical protein [Fertoeibacter niger]NUB43999.1 hypothetical protein [Fertoeibacter niger]
MKDTGRVPDDGAAQLHFLDEVAAAYLLAQLRGIRSVTLRLLGENPHALPEVTAFLEAEGFDVVSAPLERMIPPPSRRFVFRYHGQAATVTIAPDQE